MLNMQISHVFIYVGFFGAVVVGTVGWTLWRRARAKLERLRGELTAHRSELETLRAIATVDSLTGFYLRGYFFSRLEEEDERARRYGGGFAVLMLDLDGFKEINDRHGHLAGDQLLREISATIHHQLRAADIACRYGGDEFCLLLPQTARVGAHAIAERIRAAVSRRVVGVDGQALRVTVSIGLALFPDHDAGDVASLVRRSDEALYRAKRAGRDRVAPAAA